MVHSHTSGNLKQSNKKHKNGGGSKRATKRGFGPGKVDKPVAVKAVKSNSSLQSLAKDARLNRLNHERQQKKNKRSEVWLLKRIGSHDGPSKIIGVIPLSDMADTNQVITSLLKHSSWNNSKSGCNYPPVVHANFPLHRSKVSFIQSTTELSSVLEVARIVDIILFVGNVCAGAEGIVNEAMSVTLSALRTVGIPTSVGYLQGIEKFNGAAYLQLKRSCQRLLEQEVVTDIKVVEGGDTHVIEQSLRTICSISPKEIHWREIRSYLLADSIHITSLPTTTCTPDITTTNDNDNTTVECTVSVSGYLRGRPMRLHSLMHVCGGGTDSLSMEAEPDSLMGEQTWPTSDELEGGGSGGSGVNNGEGGDVDDGTGRSRRNVPTELPVGMSSYQADCKIKGGAGGVGIDIEDKMSQEKQRVRAQRRMEYLQGEMSFPDEMDTPDDIPARSRFARYRALASFRSSPWHPRENLPSEYSRIFQFQNFLTSQRRFLSESAAAHKKQSTDILLKEGKGKGSSQSSRSRSQSKTSRSRSSSIATTGGEGMGIGMEVEGGNGNGNTTRNTSDGNGSIISSSHELLVQGGEETDIENPFVKTGRYVTLVITNVPMTTHTISTLHTLYNTSSSNNNNNKGIISLQQQQQSSSSISTLLPVQIYSLLPYENKLSVLHFNITRFQPSPMSSSSTSSSTAITPMNMDTDIDIENNNNITTSGNNNGMCEEDIIQGKDELIFQVGFRTFSARPVFSEANLNCDKHKMERFLLPGRFSVASVFGPVTYQPSGVDPDRIVLKKVILTGHPVRARKRYAVVKHLFHTPEDVRWFKPAELVTKHGLRGHIREPVGTHGLLKAIFNASITQNDTVMLVLYKRVFPKFPEEGVVRCV
eukprot:gene1443-2777_t